MTVTVAFDVYGTLIDTHAVVAKLREWVGDRAGEFSQSWRDKQLEYSFRRGLMGRYEDFGVCTRQALDYTCDYLGLPLSDSQKADLIELYRVLPAFDDVEEGLADLEARGLGLYAFSNGSAAAVEALLVTAGIRGRFAGVVSVEGIRSFKPDPAVYAHFLERTGSRPGDAWLVSSNPFDVIGAVSAGMRAAWVRRSPQAIFDPWGIEPTVTVAGLAGLGEAIAA
jgi:2-haloacid dehalogenase